MSLFTFDPSYLREDVVFYQANLSNPAAPIITAIPDWWCATEAGEAAMKLWLQDLGLTTTEIEQFPFTSYQDGVFTTQANINANPNAPTPVRVPFLQDTHGATENVGYLMDMFKVLPVEFAMRTDLTEFALDDTQ